MSQLENIKQAKALHKSQLLSHPNVVGVGVGFKTRGKTVTDQLSVVVLVRQKFPAVALTEKTLIPKEIGGIQTDVMEVGDLRPLDSRTARWRPAPGGVSLGHFKITAGTLGCVVYDQRTNERLILSNNHILANRNAAEAGDPILQPAPADGGTVESDILAHLDRFIPLSFVSEPATCSLAKTYALIGNLIARSLNSQHHIQAIRIPQESSNLVDAAVARPIDDSLVLEETLEIGQVNGVAEAELGMSICKSGRTTEFTTGIISVLDATVTVGYGWESSATFEKQIVSTPMSKGGDSGSLMLTQDSHQAVGLLFAGSEQATLFNPIQAVINSLNIKFKARPASKSPDFQAAIARAQVVQAANKETLLAKKNVVGVGVGLRHRGGKRTDEVAIIVMVRLKVPKILLASEDIIPSEIDGIPVDVKEVGRIKAY